MGHVSSRVNDYKEMTDSHQSIIGRDDSLRVRNINVRTKTAMVEESVGK